MSMVPKFEDIEASTEEVLSPGLEGEFVRTINQPINRLLAENNELRTLRTRVKTDEEKLRDTERSIDNEMKKRLEIEEKIKQYELLNENILKLLTAAKKKRSHDSSCPSPSNSLRDITNTDKSGNAVSLATPTEEGVLEPTTDRRSTLSPEVNKIPPLDKHFKKPPPLKNRRTPSKQHLKQMAAGSGGDEEMDEELLEEMADDPTTPPPSYEKVDLESVTAPPLYPVLPSAESPLPLDEERKQFKKSCETKEKQEAQVQIAEKHVLFAHEEKKMLELSIQSSTLESASSMTSGVESMDEQSELYEDRKAELEAMDTFTGQIEPFDLRGVEVLARTTVIVTNSPQTFHWKGYGFKLTIPQGSLPAGVDQCRLDIKASVAGQYQFPDNLQLVSGFFWIRPLPLCQFQQQLTVEIQHCAKMTNSTKLSFVRAHCSQESLPYTFKQLEGRGSFTKHSSYGCLSVNHFSSYAIAAEGDVDLLYVASLYYLKVDPRTVEIHFTINVDDEIHIAETRKHFSELGAKEKLNLELEFDDSNISLDITLPSGVDVNEWSLVPLVPPMISKRRVDSFKPGRTVPSTKLEETLSESSWDCKVPKRSHLITLKGAKEPKNQMMIVLDPVDPNKVAPPPQVPNPMSAVAIPGQQSGDYYPAPASTLPSLQGSYDHHDRLYALQFQGTSRSLSGLLHPAITPQPTATIEELVTHVGIDKDLLNQPCSTEHLTKIAPFVPNWQKYAIVLGLNQPQILSISSNSLLEPEMKAQQVLSLWKQANGFKATYHCQQLPLYFGHYCSSILSKYLFYLYENSNITQSF